MTETTFDEELKEVFEPPPATEKKTVPNLVLRAFELQKSFKEGGARHVAITNAILYYICVDHKLFYTVKGRGFLELMKQLAPQYHIPSDTHLKKLMTDKFTALKSALKEKLKSHDCFSLTCDIWTETMNMTSFLGVTLHYLERQNLKSAHIATLALQERHTGKYIAEKLPEVLENWGINKANIMAVLTNNGTNMVSAVKVLFSNEEKHLPCFAHTINLIAEKVVSEGKISLHPKNKRNC